MILETACVGEFRVNCYILASAVHDEAIIIDPGDDELKIRRILQKHKLKPGLIINTHGHIDHIGCNGAFSVPVYVHRKDAALLKDPRLNLSSLLAAPYSATYDIKTVDDGEEIHLDTLRLEVIHTPGHTPGGMCLLMKSPEKKILFSGDTLFFHGVGRTDFPGADERLLFTSIQDKLFHLDDDTVVHPGHGPSSTIGEEKRNNPFLR